MAINNMERPGQRGDDYPSECGREVQVENTADFFNCIALGQEGLVRDFIEQDSEMSNKSNKHGETALIAAVRAGNPAIVRDLLWNGAKVDTLGYYSQEGRNDRALRTPLQVAAAEGKLYMIRILRENRADVFLAAPDGVNALQLATSNGHESVVDHIRSAYASTFGSPPVASGGLTPDTLTETAEVCSVGCQKSAERDQARHTRTRNEKSSVCITWTIPKFTLQKTSKTIISAISNVLVDRPKETRLCRKDVELWCQEQIQEFPTRLKRGIHLADRGSKEAAELVTKTPERSWQLVKRTPNAIWTIMLYIGMALHKLGKIAPHLLKLMTNTVKTIAKAVVGVFQAATLHGIKSGFSSILQTAFTKVTTTLSWFITGLRQASCAMLQTVMGSLKRVIIIFAALTLGICILFSKRTWGVLQASGKLAKKGVQEILESMGPKTM